jgi:hypothetical protein
MLFSKLAFASGQETVQVGIVVVVIVVVVVVILPDTGLALRDQGVGVISCAASSSSE